MSRRGGLGPVSTKPIKPEYQEVELTTSSVSVSADTWVDVAGSTITLGGKARWQVGYSVLGWMQYISGSSTHLGNVAIFTFGNTLVEPSMSMIWKDTIASTADQIAMTMTMVTTIDVASETAYKLRLRSSVAAAVGKFFVFHDSFTGAVTDPDHNSIFWARKIKDV